MQARSAILELKRLRLSQPGRVVCARCFIFRILSIELLSVSSSISQAVLDAVFSFQYFCTRRQVLPHSTLALMLLPRRSHGMK